MALVIMELPLHEALLTVTLLQVAFLLTAQHAWVFIELYLPATFLHPLQEHVGCVFQLLLLMLDVRDGRLVVITRLCQHLQVIEDEILLCPLSVANLIHFVLEM